MLRKHIVFQNQDKKSLVKLKWTRSTFGRICVNKSKHLTKISLATTTSRRNKARRFSLLKSSLLPFAEAKITAFILQLLWSWIVINMIHKTAYAWFANKFLFPSELERSSPRQAVSSLGTSLFGRNTRLWSQCCKERKNCQGTIPTVDVPAFCLTSHAATYHW